MVYKLKKKARANMINDEKSYARVSEVLAKLRDFSGIPPYILEKKAELGTDVHLGINDYIQGYYPIPKMNDQRYMERYNGYLQSYTKWHKEVNPDYRMHEKRFYCDKIMLTGQIDGLIKIGRKKPMLIDFKTSAKVDNKTWPLQGHLYHYLISQSDLPVSTTILFLKLSDKGEYPEVCEYKYCKSLMGKCLDMVKEFWEEKSVDTNSLLW